MYVNFTPGPSQLYFTVEQHIRAAMRSHVGSLSHRSKEFESIFQQTTEALREVLGIPAGHSIFFTGSATEIWERAVQNLSTANTFHFVNGSFSKRFAEIATQLSRHASTAEAPAGEAFKSGVTIPQETELIAVTHNETSTGVSMPLDVIHSLKAQHPHALVIVDAVSSLPYPQFDYSKIDSVFFSVQKGFGLPAGLGVWIVNDACLTRAEQLQKSGALIGTYHNLPTLKANEKKNQTPETPNVLAIYLLGKVARDMANKGIEAIRRETDYKAALLYHALKSHEKLSAFVKDENVQSKTVIVADCGHAHSNVVTALSKADLIPGEGYGEFKKTQLRFANFPTHSKEQFELLADTLVKV